MSEENKVASGKNSERGTDPLRAIQDALQDAASFVSGVAADAGKAVEGITAAFGPKFEVASEYCAFSENGTYSAPDPVLDQKEREEIILLKDRYDELTAPGVVEKALGAASDLLPRQVKDLVQQAGDALTAQQFYSEMMDVVANGFEKVEQLAASVMVREQDVLQATNRAYQHEVIRSVDEICLLRAYNVAAVAHAQNYQHTIASLVEGGTTGAVGFAGIPFNVVLSTLLYYRAVQSIAMYYGYDVKRDPSEMIIASEVFAAALAPRGASLGGGVAMIGKVMALAEAATVRTVVKRGWLAMAQQGGACLLIAQMRALANNAAKKALQKAGQEGLEKSVIRNVLTQIGQHLPQKAVQRGVPVIGGIIGALFDAGMMGRVLDYADIFYHKRFLVEKELRVSALVSGVDLDSGFTEDIVDAIAGEEISDALE